MRMLKNVRFCVSNPGKNYPAAIKEKFSDLKLMFSESFREMKCSRRFLRQIISANNCKPRPKPLPQTGIPRVGVMRQFVSRLCTGWHPYTSERLKRGVGAFVGRCRGARFCLQNVKSSTEGIAGRLDDFPSLPAAFSDPDSARFCLIRLRKIPKARAEQRVRKKSRRKPRRFSAPERPLLPAVRAVFRVSRWRFYGRRKMRLTLFQRRRGKRAAVCGFALTLFNKRRIFQHERRKRPSHGLDKAGNMGHG